MQAVGTSSRVAASPMALVRAYFIAESGSSRGSRTWTSRVILAAGRKPRRCCARPWRDRLELAAPFRRARPRGSRRLALARARATPRAGDWPAPLRSGRRRPACASCRRGRDCAPRHRTLRPFLAKARTVCEPMVPEPPKTVTSSRGDALTDKRIRCARPTPCWRNISRRPRRTAGRLGRRAAPRSCASAAERRPAPQLAPGEEDAGTAGSPGPASGWRRRAAC